MHSGVVLRLVLTAIMAVCASVPGSAQPPAPLLVFAASDLGPAFGPIVAEFERQTRTDVTLVLGSTGMLAQQIRNGAPADVFFAANETFITDLTAENLTVPDTSAVYARGRIAIVTLKSSGLRIHKLQDLRHPRIRRIAIANPQHAPYGLAARQALQAAGLWAAVEPGLAFGENVQQAVQFVRSGSVDAGVVARSVADAPELHWTLVDDRLYAPLNQRAVVLARTAQPAASRSFIAFVTGTAGRSVLQRFGFAF